MWKTERRRKTSNRDYIVDAAFAVWIGMHIQVGPHGVGYVGTQAAFAFIVTLIQGEGPPDSIMPGVDRFAGIVGGLAILMVVSMVLWPSDDEIAEQKAAARE